MKCSLRRRLRQIAARIAILAALGGAAPGQFNDTRDPAASKAKTQIKSVRKKISKLDDAISDDRKLKRPGGVLKELEKIRKLLEKVAAKDPAWDTAPEAGYLTEFEPRFRAAAAAYADRAYRADFEKALGKVTAGLEDPRRLADYSWFRKQVGGFDRFFKKVARNEPDRDVSAERAELAEFLTRAEVACRDHARGAMEAAEPDPAGAHPAAVGGAETAAAVAPDWCEDADLSGRPFSGRGGGYLQLVRDQSPRALRAAAAHACRAPDFDKRRAWSAAWRQGLINETGLPDARVREAQALFLKIGTPEWDGWKAETCAPYQRRDGRPVPGQAAPTPDRVAFDRATAIGLGCEGLMVTAAAGDFAVSELEWWLDRRAEPPSELVRAVFVLSQIGVHLGEDGREKSFAEAAQRRLGGYAFAGADARRLDEAKFREQLAAMDLNPYGRFNAEVTFSRARHHLARYKEVYAGLSPEMKELAEGAPEAGFAAWEAEYASSSAAHDAALAVERAAMGGRPAEFEGRFKTAFDHFSGYLRARVAAADAASVEAVEDLAFGPLGYGLASATVVAAAYEGRFHYAAELYGRLEDRRLWRGPRWAAYWSTIDRFAEMKRENPGLGIEQRDVARWIQTPSPSWVYKAYEKTFNQAGAGAASGVVESLSGSGLLSGLTGASAAPRDVTFVTESYVVPVYDCVETGKIDRIESDGTIKYRRRCTRKGEKTVDSTEKPVVVDPRFVAGIAAGNLFTGRVAYTAAREAIPRLVWETPAKEKLVNFIGVGLR